MEFRDCFRHKPEYLQYWLAQSILDRVVARINGADLRFVDYNIKMWEHYLIEALFERTKE